MPPASKFVADHSPLFLAGNNLFLFDFDGTLADFSEDPEATTVPPSCVDNLERLARLPTNNVTLLSGRVRSFLAQFFSSPPIDLVEEHGAEVLQPEGGRGSLPSSVVDILQEFCHRYPKSFLEYKKASMVWHYRVQKADVDLDETMKLLKEQLEGSLWRPHFYDGAIEIQSAAVSKQNYFRHVARQWQDWPFVIAFGDDESEKQLFEILPPGRSVTVGVGPQMRGHCQWHVSDPLSLREWLSDFVHELQALLSYQQNPQNL